MERPGPLVVIGSTRQRNGGQLFPPVGKEARHEDVVGARELAADFGDLRGGLAFCENDFREPDAAQAIEVECVIRLGHSCRGLYP